MNIKMVNRIALGLTLGVALLFSSCKSRQVTRMDPSTQTDLSGRWNDTDARLTAEAMIEQCLGGAWLYRFEEAEKREPVVIVGFVQNKSSEHIDADVFIKELEKEFIKRGSVRVVQNSLFRQKIREERADQQDFASLDTRKKFGKELGADFMLTGTIAQIIDQYGKQKTSYYQVDLELANLETNEKVWIGDKKIKKGIRN